MARAAITLLLLSLLPARAGAEARMWGLATSGVGEMVDGKLTRAVRTLAQARAAKPAPGIDALVGLVALKGGKPALALRQLRVAIERGSVDHGVFYWAARAALAARQTGAALKHVEQALAIGGDRPTLRMGHALILSSLGRGRRAAGALLLVAAREPNLLDPSLYPTADEGAVELLGRLLTRHRFPHGQQLERVQGHMLWRAGRTVASMKHFTKLLASRPGDPDVLQMLARFRAAVGQNDLARRLADRAVRRAPGSALALAARGEILLEQGDAPRALKDLRKAADAYPRDSRLLTRLAQACSEAARTACAERFYRYALRRDTRIAAAHLGLALHYQHQRKPAEARRSFRRAIALDPGNPRTYRAAANFAHLDRDPKRASRLLAEARRADVAWKRFSRFTRSANAQISRQMATLAALVSSPDCAATDCVKALNRTPPVARLMIQAHLAYRKGHKKRAATLISKVLPRLKAARLLNRNPTSFETSGKTLDGATYELRKGFPLVPPSTFR